MTEKLSDNLTAIFLQAIIISLRENVMPFVSNPVARTNADQLTRTLYMLHSRFSRRGEDLQKLIAEDKALLKKIAALLPGATEGSPPVADNDYFSAIERLECERSHNEMQLISKLPQLLELAVGDGAKKRAAINNLRMLVDTQQIFLAAQDPDILKGSYVCYQGGKIDEERPYQRAALLGAEINEENLTQHLQRQFPGSRAEKLSVMAGGFSKTTIFFTLVKASGESESLVIRKDLPIFFNSSVAYEFPLLKQIHKTGFPVAEPLWLEEDAKPFGGRFMVSRRVGGSTDFGRWAGDKQAVDNFARQLAKAMVDLHSLSLEQLGYPVAEFTKSAGDLMREEIERWGKIFVDSRDEVHPLVELSLAWLKNNIPEKTFSRQASLVHGDIGFHNMMIDEGKVSALLDWEFSHLGDAIEDLIYTKPFIEKVMDWETFKSYYREYGGEACTAEEEFFYVIWSKTRSPTDCTRSMEIFTDSLPHDLKYAVSGTILGRYLELEAAQMIVDALAAK
jgi:aminoglycoside phosphotransferase (APT) family kinase protein